MFDESDDSDFELDSSSSEGESSAVGEIEDNETFEATTSNKENMPILDTKKEIKILFKKKKASEKNNS